MLDPDSVDYYKMRERQERSLAGAAADPRVVAIHLHMAARYHSMAHGPRVLSDQERRRPKHAFVASSAEISSNEGRPLNLVSRNPEREAAHSA